VPEVARLVVVREEVRVARDRVAIAVHDERELVQVLLHLLCTRGHRSTSAKSSFIRARPRLTRLRAAASSIPQAAAISAYSRPAW
jgi:hypothetical protein